MAVQGKGLRSGQGYPGAPCRSDRAEDPARSCRSAARSGSADSVQDIRRRDLRLARADPWWKDVGHNDERRTRVTSDAGRLCFGGPGRHLTEGRGRRLRQAGRGVWNATVVRGVRSPLHASPLGLRLGLRRRRRGGVLALRREPLLRRRCVVAGAGRRRLDPRAPYVAARSSGGDRLRRGGCVAFAGAGSGSRARALAYRRGRGSRVRGKRDGLRPVP